MDCRACSGARLRLLEPQSAPSRLSPTDPLQQLRSCQAMLFVQIYFKHMYFCLHVCTCATCAPGAQKSGEGIGFHGTGVMGGCELQMVAGSRTLVLCKSSQCSLCTVGPPSSACTKLWPKLQQRHPGKSTFLLPPETLFFVLFFFWGEWVVLFCFYNARKQAFNLSRT